MVNFALFGPPGSGKGTQSDLLLATYNLAHIAPGNIFRAEVKKQTPLGHQLQTYIDAGNLVPEELTMRIIGEKMTEAAAADQYLLLDGYPRSLPQAQALEDHLQHIGKPLQVVIFLDVDLEEIRQRIATRGQLMDRADDQSETILNHRLHVYESATLPVARYYEAQKKLVRINGMGNVEEVHQRIMETLAPHLPPTS